MSDPTSWSCFGRLWERGRVECEGGFDLAYVDPEDGTRLRKRCSGYDACRQAKETGVNYYQRPPLQQPLQQPLVPTQNLVRPQAPILAPPVPPPFIGPQSMVQQPMMPRPPVPASTHVPPWVAQYGPQTVPIQFQQPGAQMPAYLAVPEPIDGTPWWLRLIAEILRSVAKAVGHSAASFFDHNPIKMHQQPVQPTPPAPVVQQQQRPN